MPGAQDDAVLEAVKAAKDRNIAEAILVGDEAKIRTIASVLKMNADEFEIINVVDPIEAARTAVKLVHDGKADMYMKGLIDTKSFLKSVLDKGSWLLELTKHYHMFAYLMLRVSIICYSYQMLHLFLILTLIQRLRLLRTQLKLHMHAESSCPKVAPLAAVEVVNPKMPCTVDAEALTKMNESGEITGCIVDGPLSLDLAIEPEAAFHKGTTNRKIVGDADVLLFPDIQAGNITYKCLVHTADVKNGNILTGTKVPVILTSRSDEFEVKVNSICISSCSC